MCYVRRRSAACSLRCRRTVRRSGHPSAFLRNRCSDLQVCGFNVARRFAPNRTICRPRAGQMRAMWPAGPLSAVPQGRSQSPPPNCRQRLRHPGHQPPSRPTSRRTKRRASGGMVSIGEPERETTGRRQSRPPHPRTTARTPPPSWMRAPPEFTTRTRQPRGSPTPQQVRTLRGGRDVSCPSRRAARREGRGASRRERLTHQRDELGPSEVQSWGRAQDMVTSVSH